MGTGHSHHDHGALPPAPPAVRWALGLAVAPFLLATVVGLVLLRPTGDPDERLQHRDLVTVGDRHDATVVALDTIGCAGPVVGDVVGPGGEVGADGGPARCVQATIRLDEGPEEGQEFELTPWGQELGPKVAAGDGIVVVRVDTGAGVSYGFDDFQRRAPLLLLAVLFTVVVVAVARWRGLAALVGLAVSGVVLLAFVIPAILDGSNAVAVAVVGSATVIFVILYVAHGFNVRTTTALLGTLAALVLTAGLAVAFVGATHLTGLSEEAATNLQVAGSRVNLTGLILAGILIGTVGVLNDVTVTQASAAWEIHLANPGLGARRVFLAGMRVGRDHIASVVDTLFLAYAGAALPLLILFAAGDRGFLDVLTGEVVAKEVVGTLVGSIGLVASVPLTTALAAVVASRVVPAATTGVEPPPGPTGGPAAGDAGADAGGGAAVDAGEPPARAGGDEGASPGPAARKERRGAAASRRRRPATDWSPPKAEREFRDGA